jgi:hypothetical protein
MLGWATLSRENLTAQDLNLGPMRTPEQGLGMIVSFGTDQKATPFFELSLRFLVDRSIASSPVQLPGIPVKRTIGRYV